MSFDDVDPFEMDGRDLPEIDDPTAETLLSGSGRDLDPALADVLGDLRVAFRSESPAPGRELTALMTGASIETATTRRFARMRRALATRIAAVTALAVASTGGLAAAGALPGPAQEAVARAAEKVGFDLPANGDDGPDRGNSDDHRGGPNQTSTSTTTTTTGDTTDATTPSSTDQVGTHGAEVSAVARDHTTVGCKHGRAVSAIASGSTNDRPCPPRTTTSISSTSTPATTTTVDENPARGGGPEIPGPPPSTGRPAEPGHGRPAGAGVQGTPHSAEGGAPVAD
jgi:hypothetical protein